MLMAQSTAVLAGLGTGSYFPLDVGDRWVYRIDSRAKTAAYETWRVDRTQALNGNTYSVIDIEGPNPPYYEAYYRADSSGRIWVANATGEQLFLDPAGQSSGAVLQIISQGGPAKSSLGTFPNSLTYSNMMPGNLIQEIGTLAQGVGLLTSTANLLTGSSGGPVEIRTLVEAEVAGGIRFPAPVPSVQLGMSLTLDVSGMNVTNCAIPCYFVACYLGGADPVGTYKPCAEARIGLANWPAAASHSVVLQFLSPNGTALFSSTLSMDSSPIESVTFIQMPLYSAPNVPFPPGTYQLFAKSADGSAQSALSIQLQ